MELTGIAGNKDPEAAEGEKRLSKDAKSYFFMKNHGNQRKSASLSAFSEIIC